MGYIHGLGDEQERLALEFDAQNEHIDGMNIKCPKCKKIESVEIEDSEYGECDEDGYETIYTCYCEDCEHEFIHYHWEDMS